MIDRMDRISDLALNMGAFELDNELESGLELSQRLQLQVVCRQFRASEFHQEALRVAELQRHHQVVANQSAELVLS